MKKMLLYLFALCVVVVLAACGQSEEPAAVATGPATGELNIVATNWAFDQEEYKVKQGETLTVALNSKEGAHNIKIQGLNVEVKANQSKDVTFSKPGTYEIICSLPCGTGHNEMKAKLVVE